MSEKRPNSREARAGSARSAAIIEQLAQPLRLAYQSPRAVRIVMAIRLIALCAQNGRDPVGELTCQIGSVPAARAVLELADCAGQAWPENVQVFKPCCCMVSPDENTFVGMINAALAGDRAAFTRTIEGFISRNQHDRLYAHAVEAVALLP